MLPGSVHFPSFSAGHLCAPVKAQASMQSSRILPPVRLLGLVGLDPSSNQLGAAEAKSPVGVGPPCVPPAPDGFWGFPAWLVAQAPLPPTGALLGAGPHTCSPRALPGLVCRPALGKGSQTPRAEQVSGPLSPAWPVFSVLALPGSRTCASSSPSQTPSLLCGLETPCCGWADVTRDCPCLSPCPSRPCPLSIVLASMAVWV